MIIDADGKVEDAVTACNDRECPEACAEGVLPSGSPCPVCEDGFHKLQEAIEAQFKRLQPRLERVLA